MSTRPAHLMADLGTGTPKAQTPISTDLVRRLIASQFPALADMPVSFVAEGWDNAMYGVGEDLCARIPRRKVAEDLIKLEQKWLTKLAPSLPVAIPAVVHVGKPAMGYPWAWSLVPWFEGEEVGTSALDEGEGQSLGQFLKALHKDAPKNAPISDCRGGPLTTRVDLVAFRSARLAADFAWIAPDIMPIWQEGFAAPPENLRTWLHGDLHPRNVLMRGGKLSAVIDWGDMCAGDPATDLAALWMLLPNPQSRALAIDVYQPTKATLLRAKAWAITWGLLLLDTGRVDSPKHAVIGETILRQVLMG
jgi:aminoglycoside phosphotransferase (APT) family kinase protein